MLNSGMLEVLYQVSAPNTVGILHLQLVGHFFSSDWTLDGGIIINCHVLLMQLVGVEQIIVSTAFPYVGVGVGDR